MELIINFDKIQDKNKKTYLLHTLKFLGISFKTTGEVSQTLEEYNEELEKANAEIDNGNFITMEQFIKEIDTW